MARRERGDGGASAFRPSPGPRLAESRCLWPLPAARPNLRSGQCWQADSGTLATRSKSMVFVAADVRRLKSPCKNPGKNNPVRASSTRLPPFNGLFSIAGHAGLRSGHWRATTASPTPAGDASHLVKPIKTNPAFNLRSAPRASCLVQANPAGPSYRPAPVPGIDHPLVLRSDPVQPGKTCAALFQRQLKVNPSMPVNPALASPRLPSSIFHCPLSTMAPSSIRDSVTHSPEKSRWNFPGHLDQPCPALTTPPVPTANRPGQNLRARPSVTQFKSRA